MTVCPISHLPSLERVQQAETSASLGVPCTTVADKVVDSVRLQLEAPVNHIHRCQSVFLLFVVLVDLLTAPQEGCH